MAAGFSPVIVVLHGLDGAPIVRVFIEAKPLLEYLEEIQRSGNLVRAMSSDGEDLVDRSVQRLNYFLHESGVAVLYFQMVRPGQRNAVSWGKFNQALALKWQQIH